MKVIPLSNHNLSDFVSITGADATKFLQGQVTCDLQQLSPGNSVRGALCNLKGRVIADFRLVRLVDDQILLQTSSGNGQKVVETLQRYAVFSDVELKLSDQLSASYGVIGNEAKGALQELFNELPGNPDEVATNDEYSLICLPGSETRLEIWCYSEQSRTKLERLDVMEDLAELEDWVFEDIHSGIAHVLPEASEKYTPQLLNYDVSGVVDFEKGCYTGQEVVARMFYRGKPKKRLYRIISNSNLASEKIQASLENTSASIEVINAIAQPGSTERFQGLAIASTKVSQSSQVGDGIEIQIEELKYSDT